MKHSYTLYDFILHSDIKLPNLTSHQGSSNSPQVTIQYATLNSEGLENPDFKGLNYQISRTDFWLNIPTIAKFQVSHGNQILVHPNLNIDDDSIRTFLLSTCLEVLMRQRQQLVLSGFALNIAQQGVVFVGLPNNGLAMLQGILFKKGYSFLASQFTVINNKAEILPGVPQLEFWPAVASALGFDLSSSPILRPEIKKYVIPTKSSQHLNTEVIYSIKMHTRANLEFTELTGKAKQELLEPLCKNNQVGVALWPLEPQLNILHDIPLVQIQIPSKGLKLPEVIQAIENDLSTRSISYA